MNTSFIKFTALAIVFGMSMAASPAYSQGRGKGKEHLEAKGKHAVTPANFRLASNSSQKERKSSFGIAKKER